MSAALTASWRRSSRRTASSWKPDWEDAYKEIANAFKAVKGDAVGVVASARNSNEDSFVLKNFAANVLKTANIDYCGRRCNADAVKGLADAFGNGATTNSLADLSDAKAILIVGSNPLEENPLAGRRIIIAKQNGAKIIVADARTTATARLADLHISCNPGTGVAFVNGIITAIVKAGKENKDYIAKHTKDFEKAKAAAASCTPDAVAKAAGIDAGLVTKAAEMFAAAQPAAVVTSAGAGSGDLIRALANLQLVTGNVGNAGTGVNLLRGKSNAQGAADVGAVPGEGGLSVPAMIDAAAAGKIKALYVVGENIASAGAHVADALGKLDFLVVQDLFMTATAAKANVVLPSASFAERDGTVTNAERRVQRIRKAIEPVGSSKADWQIISELAKAMGHEKDFAFKDAEAIFGEIAKAVPAYAGITYAKLEKPEAVQWPADRRRVRYRDPVRGQVRHQGRQGRICRSRVQGCRGSDERVPVCGGRTVAHGHALFTHRVHHARVARAKSPDQCRRCKGAGRPERFACQSHRKDRLG